MNKQKIKSLAMWLVIGVLGTVAIAGTVKAVPNDFWDVVADKVADKLVQVEGMLGASGTRFPNGISADSTSPIAGEVRGTTLTSTGATTLGSTISAAGLATLNAGQLRSYTNATSTIATAQTLLQADILNYDTVLFTPNTASVTLTMPATSTLTSFIPTAGDMAEQCWHNATSTASINITFAAGAGMDLQRVATSTTAGSAGVLALPTGNSACFKFIRQTNTDVQALMTSFVDAD